MRKVTLSAILLFVAALTVLGQGVEPVLSRARAERAAMIDSMRDLVAIESGSSDIEGLNRISDVIAGRLRALGADVQLVEPPADMVRFANTPARTGRSVVGRFRGTGTRRILLLAHMDTVYQRGMLAKQPFRIQGDRAYGLGIADDKHGIALILHTMAILNALSFRDYGVITVLINGDEEVSSPGSRALITRLGSEHDLVLSCEGHGPRDDVRLTTAGIAAVQLKVTGRASHSGSAPEEGRNALYELAHQIMQTRDLSNAQTGVKVNWTLANAGTVRNSIPASAQATADVRVLRLDDYDVVEKQLRDRITNQLIPDTRVELVFERARPPLEATSASRAVAAYAQRIYRELGRDLIVQESSPGGGTDAAFAGLDTKAAVIEGLGLKTFGAHSNDAEYVELGSIEPRLYLLARLIMDAAQGKTGNSTN